MSSTSTTIASGDGHSGPIKTPKQLLLAAFFAIVVPIFVIIGLVYSVTSQYKPAAGAVDLETAIMQRIQKVGMVEIRSANRTARTGEQVFKAQCTNCHAAGLVGAHKFGDATAWAPRIKTGFAALVNSALKGKNAMGAQGGGEFEDFEVARGVAYMANAAGAKFAEPPKPAAPETTKLRASPKILLRNLYF
jgi:cytochrome c5